MVSEEMVNGNAALISQIEALLALDERGALVPHGIGGLARDLFKGSLAALRAGGEPVAVKPLEWHASPIRENSWLAPHGFGENYVAYRYEGQWRCIGQDWPSLEAAKAAAQADYEQRIRSALVSAPSDLERELAEARANIGIFIEDRSSRIAREKALTAERDALAADKARLADAQAEKPHCRIDQSDLPLWQQINAIFERHGWSSPGTRFRDTLVMILAWARYGEALDAALSSTSDPAEARREALEEAAKIADSFAENNRGGRSPEAFAAYTVSTEIARYIRAISTPARREGE